MTAEELINLIGKPISNIDVQSMFKCFGYKEPKKGSYTGSIYEKEINVSFLSKWSFDITYTEPPYEFSNDDYIPTPFENPDLPQLEFIVEEITINSEFKGSLPFGLKREDKYETFKKLGSSNGKSTSIDGDKNYFFLNEKYMIQIFTSKEDVFKSITVNLINNGTKHAKKKRKMISAQNKNISIDNQTVVNDFKNKKPTKQWYQNLLENTIPYEKESIDKTDLLLMEFVDNLVTATKEKKASKVLSSVRKLVLAINKLNRQYDFIYSTERDDLCDFIMNAIKATGFECDYDLSEEWRKW